MLSERNFGRQRPAGLHTLARPGTPAGSNLLNGLDRGSFRPLATFVPFWEAPAGSNPHPFLRV
jgi:hypothetical protein